jgi:transposase
MLTREEILALCASNPEVIAYIVSLESQIKELTERVIALESLLNQNSRNSSRPPSTDFAQKKPNPKSRREKSDKKAGGQEGHSGTTLEMVNEPE